MQPLLEPGEAEKHALQHAVRTDMSHQKNITTDSWIEVSARSQAKETVRPDVEESKKYPCLAASASLWRLPSLLAMTHMAVVARTKWATEHRVHTVWSSVSVGCRLGPSMVLEQGCGAEVNVGPRSLEQNQVERHTRRRGRNDKKTIS